MKGACAVVIDDNRIFISFGILRKSSFKFLKETSLTLTQPPTDLISSIRDNAEVINQAIEEVERSHSLKVDKVFCELPQNFTNTKVVSDIVPLRGKKRISSFDINFIKKYLEDKFLDWDDYSIHSIALQFRVRGEAYSQAPYGLWAKKLLVKSLLVSVKDKVHKEIEDIFDNFNRRFGGFVSSLLSTYASVGEKSEKPQVVMRCDYAKSNFVVRSSSDLIFSQNIDFSIKYLIEKLARRFWLDFSLAEELFERYISFKEIPYFKEITVKKEGGYINLSTQTMNLFIKDYIRSKMADIFKIVRPYTGGDDFSFSFLGRLARKEGFYRFLRDCVSAEIITPLEQSAYSASFGCLRYGLLPFLELGYKKERSLLQRAVDIYREYF